MAPYPKPGDAGGSLIRKAISLLKKSGVDTPIQSPILIAVSGGVDSMVLAHLISRYGRNLVAREKITLLHLDHGWRPESSEHERAMVAALATQLGVGFRHEVLSPPKEMQKSRNLEEDARMKRLEVYDALSGPGKPYQWVLTAHHREDVAETVLWRFLRGEFSPGEAGIKALDYQCLRPLLEVSKEEILRYAQEEQVGYSEDPTNSDVRRFRAWARSELIPFLEQGFPAIRQTLAEYAHHRHIKSAGAEPGIPPALENLLQAVVQGPLNRIQRGALTRILQEMPEGQMLSLPKGVQLKRLKTGWLIEDSNPPI